MASRFPRLPNAGSFRPTVWSTSFSARRCALAGWRPSPLRLDCDVAALWASGVAQRGFRRSSKLNSFLDHDRFRLAQPLGNFLDRLQIGMLPEHALSGTTPRKSLAPLQPAPIGTGPYQHEALRFPMARISARSTCVLRGFASARGNSTPRARKREFPAPTQPQSMQACKIARSTVTPPVTAANARQCSARAAFDVDAQRWKLRSARSSTTRRSSTSSVNSAYVLRSKPNDRTSTIQRTMSNISEADGRCCQVRGRTFPVWNGLPITRISAAASRYRAGTARPH